MREVTECGEESAKLQCQGNREQKPDPSRTFALCKETFAGFCELPEVQTV